jgi:hypothetical protein
VTLDQLRASGIDFPAVVIGELELNGVRDRARLRTRPADRRPPAGDRRPRSTRLTPAMAPAFAIASNGVNEFAGAELSQAWARRVQMMIEGAGQVLINQLEHNVPCRQEVCVRR